MLRHSWLLALFALVAMSSAFNLDGVEEYIHHGVKRQASGTGNSNPPTSAPPASSAPPPASSQRPTSSPAPQPSATPAPTSDRPNSPTPAPAPSSQGPAPSTSRGGQGTPTTRTSAGNSPESTQPPASSAPRLTPIIRTSDLVSTSLQPFTTIYTSTLSDGGLQEVTSTGTNSIPLTTGRVTYTDAPTSQDGNGGNGDGLSDSNKKVIGGVVGGIGGALLLGGIALVFWRMKRRQNKVTADDDDLNLNTGAALGDKPQNGTGPSPFQSNLEQYHNPGGRPNAAANF